MNQNTKILIGIALLGVAYYLYTRKKPEAVVVSNKNQSLPNTTTQISSVQNMPIPQAQSSNETYEERSKKESGYIPCKGADGVTRNLLTLGIGTKCY